MKAVFALSAAALALLGHAQIEDVASENDEENDSVDDRYHTFRSYVADVENKYNTSVLLYMRSKGCEASDALTPLFEEIFFKPFQMPPAGYGMYYINVGIIDCSHEGKWNGKALCEKHGIEETPVIRHGKPSEAGAPELYDGPTDELSLYILAENLAPYCGPSKDNMYNCRDGKRYDRFASLRQKEIPELIELLHKMDEKREGIEKKFLEEKVKIAQEIQTKKAKTSGGGKKKKKGKKEADAKLSKEDKAVLREKVGKAKKKRLGSLKSIQSAVVDIQRTLISAKGMKREAIPDIQGDKERAAAAAKAEADAAAAGAAEADAAAAGAAEADAAAAGEPKGEL